MSKIQINDVKLDGAELFNDSETFLNQLQDSEMEQIVGGLTRVSDEYVTATVYYPREPIHPVEPHDKKWRFCPLPFPHKPQTPVIL